MPNIFDSVPVESSNVFDQIPTEPEKSPTPIALDAIKDPYDAYKLQELGNSPNQTFEQWNTPERQAWDDEMTRREMEPSLKPLSNWEKLKANATALEHKILPGTRPTGQPSPGKVIGASAMLLPVGLPEGLASKAALGYFGYNTLKSQPDYVRSIASDVKSGDYKTAARTGAEDLLNLIMLGASAKHLAGSKPTDFVIPDNTGRDLKMPPVVEPPMNVENVQPLDPQTGSPLSPQELIARQSRAPVLPETPAPEIKTWNLDETEGGQNAPQERHQPEGNQPEHQGNAGERPPAQPGSGGSVAPGAPAKANEPVTRSGDARGIADKEVPQVGDKIPKAERDAEGFADTDAKNVVDHLVKLPTGSRVVKFGNIWEKNSDGTWSHRNEIKEPGNSTTQEADTNGSRLEGGTIRRVGKGETPQVTADALLSRGYGEREPSEIANLPEGEFSKLVEAQDSTGKRRVSVTVDATAWALKHPDADPAELEKMRDDATAKQKASGGYDRSQWFSDAAHALRGDEVGNLNKDLVSKMLNIQPKEFQGMGGAVSSEFNPGGNPGRDIYGIAHEVREARERAGQVGGVERGQGISATDSVDKGRQLLKSGVDPEKTLANFESTGKWSSDDIAVTRAHGEQLAARARTAESKFGTDSPEHKAAFDKLTDWDTRTKKLQTEWHKAGQAQQGQTDIDTGSFTGIAREFKNQTGKDLTPKQTKEAKDISGKVSDAADKTEKAKQELFDQLDRESGDPKSLTDAERRALDAANKVVRDHAASRAAAEVKLRVAKTGAETEAAKAELAKNQKSLDLAVQQARDAAVKLADAENKARIKEASKTEDDAQKQATKKALDAANEVAKQAAVEKAKADNDARAAKTDAERKLAKVEVKRTQKALDIASKRARDAAAAAAKAERAQNVLKADTSAFAWQKAKEYIDQGVTNFDDIRNKLATDLGKPVSEVTKALAKTKRAKYLTDELWKQQQQYRRLDQQAKRWLLDQQTPLALRALRSIPNLAFAAKVFGHGTVALGTHAPMVAFQPRFWKAYATDFVKMYRMVGSTPFYENQIQDLVRRPNYTTARRAGLVNDPYQYEDYNSPEVTKWMGPVANMGNRGYSVLKILRQDMFDQMWNKLPKTTQIPEVAEAIARGVNHATGVVRMKAPPGSNLALFAPRLEASRAAWLVADPVRAARTFADWKNASLGDKQFAINQVKEKAWVVGTMLSLLAANEGVLEASGSNQRVNVTDPMRRDWMKFKVGGMNIGYGNAMLSMARLPARLYKIRESNGGKLKNLVYPDEDTYSVLGEFARSQESPFASLATSLWFKSDWQNRPLPNSDRPVPKRLRAQGVKPYTWPEFWTEQALPIPAEEAVREVWQHGLGMNDDQIKQARKALATISVMAATGARVEDDTDTVGR